MVLQDVAHYFALQSRKPLTAARKKQAETADMMDHVKQLRVSYGSVK